MDSDDDLEVSFSFLFDGVFAEKRAKHLQKFKNCN